MVYGTLLRAILFYKKISEQLENWGFVANDYNKYTFNKMMNGKQIIGQFHVDNLNYLHAEQSILRNLINDLKDKFKTE